MVNHVSEGSTSVLQHDREKLKMSPLNKAVLPQIYEASGLRGRQCSERMGIFVEHWSDESGTAFQQHAEYNLPSWRTARTTKKRRDIIGKRFVGLIVSGSFPSDNRHH